MSPAATEVGIDIIETHRIRGVLEKHDTRFLQRVYTEWERMYCKRNVLHLAGRWAAKEAVMKVLGTGFTTDVGWTDIEVVTQPSGQPVIVLHGKVAANHWYVNCPRPVLFLPCLAGQRQMRNRLLSQQQANLMNQAVGHRAGLFKPAGKGLLFNGLA